MNAVTGFDGSGGGGGGCGDAVVKVCVLVARGLPAVSRMAAAPPRRVTVYAVPAARAEVGSIVSEFPVDASVTVAATTAPPPVRYAVDAETPVMTSLKF